MYYQLPRREGARTGECLSTPRRHHLVDLAMCKWIWVPIFHSGYRKSMQQCCKGRAGAQYRQRATTQTADNQGRDYLRFASTGPTALAIIENRFKPGASGALSQTARDQRKSSTQRASRRSTAALRSTSERVRRFYQSVMQGHKFTAAGLPAQVTFMPNLDDSLAYQAQFSRRSRRP